MVLIHNGQEMVKKSHEWSMKYNFIQHLEQSDSINKCNTINL